MALLPWDDDPLKDKDIFNPTPVKQVASVQGGSWQPAASGADSSIADDSTAVQDNGGIFNQQPQQTTDAQPQADNYLMSDQKTAVDQAKVQQDAEIEAARAQDAANRKAAADRAAAAQAFEDGKVQDQQGQNLNVQQLKDDNGWKKYYGDTFKKEKDSLDFWGRLMDGGQASKRAEVLARNKYASELLQKAYDDNGNVLDPKIAQYVKGVTAYNSALAQDGSQRSEALGRAIGATKDNQSHGFLDRVKDAINAEKQMNIYDAFAGADDGTKTDINDLGRFGGGLVQGFGTMIPIGLKELEEAGTGHGTSAQTGFEEDLTGTERGGRAVSGALNVVTPFVGGSGKLLDSLTSKVAQGTASAAERTLLKQLSRDILLPAIEQGGIGATQAGGEYFGNGNTLVDENGKIDPNKLKEFATQTGEAGAMGFTGGALLSGAGKGVNALRRRGADIPTLNPDELAELETANSNVGASELAQMHVGNETGSALQSLENNPDQVTPVKPQEQVADGVAQPVDEMTPIAAEDRAAAEAKADGVATPDGATPGDDVSTVADDPTLANRAELEANATPLDNTTPDQLVNPDPTAAAPLATDGIATPDVTPRAAELPADVTPVKDATPVDPQAAAVVPAADGTVQSGEPLPADIKPVGTDQVRALQSARVGKSQANEAVINQQLTEAQNATPKYKYQIGDTQTNVLDKTNSFQGIDGALHPHGTDATIAVKDYDGTGETKMVKVKDIGSQKYFNTALTRAGEHGEVLAVNFDEGKSLVAPTPAPRSAARTAPVETPAPVDVAADVTPVKSAKTPQVDSVPDGLGGDAAVAPETGTPLTRKQVAERLMPKLADNSDVKQRIADAAGMSKDTESTVREILQSGDVKPKLAGRISENFDKLNEHMKEFNGLQEENQKAYVDGGTDALDPEISRSRSRAAREAGITGRRLMADIKRLEGSKDKKVALTNAVAEIIGTRNANVLTSAGLIERNIMQELTANVKLAVKNPIKMASSTFQNGNILKDTAKSELSHWQDAPRSPLDAVKYVVGNTYRTAMIPTTALANVRRGAVRDELTRWAFTELEGRKVSAHEAHKLAGTAGNELEALVNTTIGADNGMSNRGQAKQAIDAWKEYIKTGDDGAKTKFLDHVEEHNSLADKMIAGLGKEDQGKYKVLKAMGQLIFPFVRTATNLAKTTVQQDLNPFAKSLLDEIRADQRSGGANAINLIKSKLVDYGIMGGAAALATSGALVYNDGDEVDKPKGWSLHIPGTDNYVPVRATSLELPIAIAGTGAKIAQDIASGDARDWKYYSGMITGSLPYIDQFNNTTGAVDSLTGMGDDSGDGGYAAKNYAVQTIKSFVPGSNNGVQPYVAGKEGKSLNAKTVYDKDFGTWLKNAIHKSYDPDFYNGLKDSRDNAGRVRTVDNQGVVSNKTINDMSTKEFNTRITDLVDYGRENGLGQNTQDMFNTYDTGKNNNFKSIQDTITFLDAPTMNGKSTPDNTKKLEKNGKLAGLSQQMRDGFFGDSGSDLLELDGQTLKSDASTPNGSGSKNAKLPISMQSIKNAIAQTDLPKDQTDKLFDISNQSSDLYAQLKAKSITYDQYSAAKAQLSDQEVGILSGSKNYGKMVDLFDELDQTGFFKPDGLGATKSGQTYLWNSLNALLGSKGATPAAEYPDTTSGFTPYGRTGTGRSSNAGGDLEGGKGVQWTPVARRQAAGTQTAQFTPFKAKVKLGNAIKKDKSQNYADASF